VRARLPGSAAETAAETFRDPERARKCVRHALAGIVRQSSARQAVFGLATAGAARGAVYLLAKARKRWRSAF
jgi:pimeloyl-CoA synthetase